MKRSKEDLLASVSSLTRDQFELRLINIETSYQLAFESAKSMDILSCTARDIARQRRMNMMVESMICALEEETNVTVYVDRIERNVQVPFPPRIDRAKSLNNYDNNR